MEETLSALTKKPWWQSDLYTSDEAIPAELEKYAGPNGIGLVKAWPSGMTDQGWGLQPSKFDKSKHFIKCYEEGDFNARRVLYGYARGRWAFAIIMRSVNLLALDIDGKNGGIEHAKKLGVLPPTLAETSKSGDGYHLLYWTKDQWLPGTETVAPGAPLPNAGFGGYDDHIGIEQGVDIRSVGCLYHHPQQRWNYRDIVPLPSHLEDLMRARRMRRTAANDRITKVVQDGDPMDTMLLHAELQADLKKPVDQGKRNNTLFAIGQKMKAAAMPDWQDHISERGTQLGLDIQEVDTLVRNIENYD